MVLLVLPALAWDTVGAVWPEMPIAYEVATPLGGGLGDDEAVAAIAAAVATWEAVDCASVSFRYDGRSTDATWGEADGRNVIFIFDDAFPGEASLVSAPNIVQDGNTLVDVDIALNARDFAWAIEGSPPVMDLQASATHELGHLLGLWHSADPAATLNPALDGFPDARTLEPDDLTGICTLYGRGDGAAGDECGDTRDCDEGLLCVAEGSTRTCAATCSGDDECAEGEICLDAGDASVCAAEGEVGCGCATGGNPAGALILAILAGAVFVSRRQQMTDGALAGGAGTKHTCR